MKYRYAFRICSALAMLMLSAASVQAQQHGAHARCGTMEYLEEQFRQHPELREEMAARRRWLAEYAAAHPQAARSGDTLYTIPVVVHIVWNTPDQNLSDSQILSQIEVLNEDFRLLNADTSTIPVPFRPLKADIGIEFCLASFDPQNNPTNGITRTQTSTASFSGGDDVKYTAQGGHDAWPAQDYLNIWVCPLGGGLLGYASSIGGGGNPATDGVVIGSPYFGRVGPNLDPAYNLGRTASHEIGHWLGLSHVWGDDAGLPDPCSGSDGIADTPNQEGPNYGCVTFPNISCNNGPDGDMFMNYMDYGDDICLTMFTRGQKAVMRATMAPGGAHRSLLSSTGCLNPGFNDIGIDTLLSPGTVACGGDLTVQARMKNYGQNVVSSAVATFELDGTVVQTLPWTGTLQPGQSVLLSFPLNGVAPGAHSLEAYTQSPNAAFDPNQGNNQAVRSFDVLDNLGDPAPYAEGIENGFPPAGWTLVNPDGGTGWQETAAAAFGGSKSVYINNFDYDAIGEADDFVLPDLDLTVFPSSGLTFRLAYAKFGPNTGFSDTLEVWVSGDCGITYTRRYRKAGNELATAPPTGNPFVPAAGQWRQEWVDLSDYAGNTGVRIRFRNITNYENNLYIDNINVVQIFALPAAPDLLSGVVLRPNPAQDAVELHAPGVQSGRLRLLDLSGREVLAQDISGPQQMLNIRALPAGVYLAELHTSAGRWTGRLVRQ